MEKSCHSSADLSNNSSRTSRSDHYLKQFNKSSLRIFKPTVALKRPDLETHVSQTQSHLQVSGNPQPNPASLSSSGGAASQPQPVHQQPPVYNINKNDFRDVVQKLTGSPAHERLATPPPIYPSKPQSSRLQRIRPPPLANLPATRPPAPVSAPGAPAVVPPVYAQRPRSPAPPFSPLPPFPTVSAAAESPISSYMRCLQSSISNSAAAGQLIFPPRSPVGLGPVLSPYLMLSPSLLFSPTAQLGFPGLPSSPRLPVPSPRWRDL
ncbi:VQ motif-containing protein 9-like [Aristolochia californica]|uniref:VQ motif-containing protein 9-like n=1 Tax=Aristolochia californica TaxID=171875 RepID=UPI0035D9A964